MDGLRSAIGWVVFWFFVVLLAIQVLPMFYH
jgi:hypothetical protein